MKCHNSHYMYSGTEKMREREREREREKKIQETVENKIVQII